MTYSSEVDAKDLLAREISKVLFQVAIQDFWRADETYGVPIDAHIPSELRSRLYGAGHAYIPDKQHEANKARLSQLMVTYNALYADSMTDKLSNVIPIRPITITDSGDNTLDNSSDDVVSNGDKIDTAELLTLIAESMHKQSGWVSMRDVRQGKYALRDRYTPEQVKQALEYLVASGKILVDNDNGVEKYSLVPKMA